MELLILIDSLNLENVPCFPEYKPGLVLKKILKNCDRACIWVRACIEDFFQKLKQGFYLK